MTVVDVIAPPALALYEEGLRAAVAGDAAGWLAELGCGGKRPLDLAAWAGGTSRADESLLARSNGPTLDIGCGPGRLAAALAHRGIPALGIDVAPVAVRMSRRAGAAALRRSVFDEVPGQGRWSTALLADGNIGIGGDPVALLVRVGQLLAPSGRALVEVEPDGTGLRITTMTLVTPTGRRSEPFRWALLDTAGLLELGAQSGWVCHERWTEDGRCFVALGRG